MPSRHGHHPRHSERRRDGERHSRRLRRGGHKRHLQCGPRAGDRRSSGAAAEHGRAGERRGRLHHHGRGRHGAARLHAPRHRGPHRLRDLPLRRGGGGRRGAAHRCGLPRGVYRGALACRERLRGKERGGRRFPALDRSAALCAPRAHCALPGFSDRRAAGADGGAAQERGLHGLCRKHF